MVSILSSSRCLHDPLFCTASRFSCRMKQSRSPAHLSNTRGGSLWPSTVSATWAGIAVIHGRRCELGLGTVALVVLAEAREKALAERDLARDMPSRASGRYQCRK